MRQKRRWLGIVQYDGMALANACEELKGDKKVVLAAVRQNSKNALGHACEKLQRGMLRFACEELKRDDKEVVLAAITQDCIALEYACEELKKRGNEVVLAAISTQHDGNVLEYVCEELKRDKKVVGVEI